MKYRIEVTVSGDRIGDIVNAVYALPMEFDPGLKILPVDPEWGTYAAGLAQGAAMLAKAKTPKKKAKTFVLPGDVAGIERPVHVGSNKGNKRSELLEAALKTGPKRWSEMKIALSEGGLSESSLNNLIGQWKKAGKIARSDDGLWSLTYAEAQRADAG